MANNRRNTRARCSRRTIAAPAGCWPPQLRAVTTVSPRPARSSRIRPIGAAVGTTKPKIGQRHVAAASVDDCSRLTGLRSVRARHRAPGRSRPWAPAGCRQHLASQGAVPHLPRSGCTGQRMADGVTNLLPFRAISGPVQGEAVAEHPASQEPGKGESTVAIERVGREEACRPRNRGGHGGDKSCVNSRCRGAA
jgi:hypothetical protein